jgi:hypothetical protein
VGDETEKSAVEEWIGRIGPPMIFGAITWMVWQHAFIRLVWPEKGR